MGIGLLARPIFSQLTSQHAEKQYCTQQEYTDIAI